MLGESGSTSGTLSIIINNYNYLKYLPECIASIDRQSDQDFELLVVDDGSTDGSWEYIATLPSRVIRMQTPNVGQARACLHAARGATGRFIHFLDADDYALPGLVAALRPHLSGEMSKIQVQMVPVSASGEVTGPPFPNCPAGYAAEHMQAAIIRQGMYISPHTSGNVFSKDLLDMIADVTYERAIDGVTLLAAPFVGKISSLPEPLVCYRLHGANESRAFDAMRFRSEARRFVDRLAHLRQLPGLDRSVPDLNWENLFYYRDRMALADVAQNGRLSLSRTIRYIVKAAYMPLEGGRMSLIACAILWCVAPRRIRMAAFERRANPWSELKSGRGFLRACLGKSTARAGT